MHPPCFVPPARDRSDVDLVSARVPGSNAHIPFIPCEILSYIYMKKGRTGTERERERARGASERTRERARERQKERSRQKEAEREVCDLIIAVKEPKESHIVGRQRKMSL